MYYILTAILYYIILSKTQINNYIVLYCIVLYCIVLYCIALHCIVLYFVLYCIVLYCIVLYCIVLYCIVLSKLTGCPTEQYWNFVNTGLTTSQR